MGITCSLGSFECYLAIQESDSMFENVSNCGTGDLVMQEDVEWSLCLHGADKTTCNHQLPLHYMDK